MEIDKTIRENLQLAQDIISSFAEMPITVYARNDKGLKRITRWSNPTFVHWLLDFWEFDKDEFKSKLPFNKLAESFHQLIENAIKNKYEDLNRSKKSQNYNSSLNLSDGLGLITPSDPQENGTAATLQLVEIAPVENVNFKFLLIPSNLKISKSESKDIFVFAGGLWIDCDKEQEAIEKIVQKIGNELTPTEKNIFYTELHDLAKLSGSMFAKNAVRIRRAFNLLRYINMTENQNAENFMEHLSGGWRISQFRDEWRKYAKRIFEKFGEHIDLLLLVFPPVTGYQEDYGSLFVFDGENVNYEEDKLKEWFEKYPKASDLYLFENDEERKDFFEGNWKEIKESIKNLGEEAGILKKITETEERKLYQWSYGEITWLFVKKTTSKLKNLDEKLEILNKALWDEFEGIKKRTQRFLNIAGDFRLKNVSELIRDFGSYFPLTDKYFVPDVINAAKKCFGISKIQYLRPFLFEGDRKFEVYQGPEKEKQSKLIDLPEDVYKKIFEEMEYRPIKSNNKSGSQPQFYEPAAVEKRVLSVVLLEDNPERFWPDGFLTKILQKLVFIFKQRTPYRRYTYAMESIREAVQEIDAEEGISSLKGKLDYVAQQIALAFTAHACTIWVYESENKHFLRVGNVGKIINVLKAGDTLSFDPDENLISHAWHMPGELIRIPKDRNFDKLKFGEQFREHKIEKGAAIAWKASKNFGVVIALWSKLDSAWDLTEEDKNRLQEIVEFLTNSLKAKYDIYFLNKTIDEMLTSIFHELKSPLIGIEGAADFMAMEIEELLSSALIVKRTKSSDKGEIYDFYKFKRWLLEFQKLEFQKNIRKTFNVLTELLDITEKNIIPILEYMKKLLSSFIFYSAFVHKKLDLNTGKPKRLRFWSEVVNNLIKRCFFYYMDEKALKLNFVYDKEEFPPYIELTSKKLEALEIIIFNLISNAIKYSKKNTVIEIEGKVRGGFVEIYVKNYGIGVPEGEEERIFEKWVRGSNAERVSPQGSGLGLFMSRLLARELGGDIKLVQNFNPTIFLLNLPIKYWVLWEEKRRH